MQYRLEKHKNTFTASLSGQFLFTDHANFKDILDLVPLPEYSEVAIDLRHLEFVDSAGLGMLLLLRDVCHKHRKRLTLQAPHGQVKRVFAISKFEHLFAMEA